MDTVMANGAPSPTLEGTHHVRYNCNDCGKGYETLRDLIAHVGTHTGEYPYVCDYCQKGYKCKTNLVNHINMHIGKGFPCPTCKKVYQSAFLLKQHVRFHVDERAFCCKICGKAFKVVELLRTHTKRFHSGKVFTCTLCRARLFSRRALDAHVKRHALQNLSCPYCKRVFKSRTSLKHHIVKHTATAEKVLSCPDCGEKFLYKSWLKTHCDRYHSHTTVFHCIYCGLDLESEDSLSSHIEEHRKVKPAPCQYCGGPLLRKHLHTSWAMHKSLTCPRCQAQFHFPSKLLEHARVHGDNPAELKWACDTCGRHFLCENKYKVHVAKPHPLSEGAINTASCGTCKQRFDTVESLKEHVKVHIGLLEPKQFDLMCHDCGTVCRTLFGLNRHRRRHTGTKRYACLYCSDVFKFLSPLQLHMKLHEERVGSLRCDMCNINFIKKSSHLVHLEFHQVEGDGVCMKCRVAFPTVELYGAHNQMHDSLPECGECKEQFQSAELMQEHFEEKHGLSKMLQCGRCNLGLARAVDLEKHERTHIQNDTSNNNAVKSMTRKTEESWQGLINNCNAEPLKTYCTCVICTPWIKRKTSKTRIQSVDSEESVIVPNPVQISPFPILVRMLSTPSPLQLHTISDPRQPNPTNKPPSRPTTADTTQPCTVPSPSKKNRSTTCAATTQPVKQHPPPSASLLQSFFALLVHVLGPEPVKCLSLAIIADVRGFVRSFMPNVELSTVKITIEDTIWLFIRCMVDSVREEEELGPDYDLEHLNATSLIKEMLKCMTEGNDLAES